MTTEEGRGLQVLRRLLNGALERMPREDARSFIDALEHDELAALLDVMSAAGQATGTGGNLFYESCASRLRAQVDESDDTHGGHQCGQPVNNQGPCVRRPGHESPCAVFRFESDVSPEN